MNAAEKPVGVYVHIPFCERKCPYCDFYSAPGNEQKYDEYTAAVIRQLHLWGKKLGVPGDTLYFGGGTPSLLGAGRLSEMTAAARSAFGDCFSEITVEVNPTRSGLDFYAMKKAGINRISVGLQSSDETELSLLGRRHSAEDAISCIRQAQSAGIDNVSVDIMLAVPHQTEQTLRRTIDLCISSGVTHISAYILKIEPDTVFGRHRDELSLPDEDEAAGFYELLCGILRENGWRHYEISNFCRDDKRGLHNLRYWHDEEYIGIGPSAHSFIDGKRFYYPRRMQDFLTGTITDDGTGGDEDEYIMLGLRLDEGISSAAFRERFGYDLPDRYIAAAKQLERHRLTTVNENGFALTEKGFLLSNAVIGQILG